MEEQEDSSPPLHAMPATQGSRREGARIGSTIPALYDQREVSGLTASRFVSKRARRVLFHFLNASATDSVRFALPGHRFQVVALDGNAVPHPQLVDVLELGTAERIDAVVTMDSPGVWILGTPVDHHREKGMGIVVEYANRSGKPSWVKPPEQLWDYTIFGESRVVPHSR